jgi:hypothetical protein
MSARTILGIDPGAHGAIAILDETGQLLDLEDMPATIEAGGRTSTNAPLLAGILARSLPMSSIANLSLRDRLMRRLQHSALGARGVLSKAPVARSPCRSSS